MKRLLKALTGITTLVLLLSQLTLAQDKEKDKDKDKSKSKNDQIIITRKTDKDTKVTIEIKGDEVLVNGKPADEYEDENVVIRKRHNVTVVSPRTPFRVNGGTWSYSDNDHMFLDGNTAFLGVTTDEDDRGAKIDDITDESAADKAGLKKGDIITKVDETRIGSPDDLTKAVRKHKPEEKATITFLRAGKEQKVTATLGKRKSAVFGNAYTPKLDINPNFNFNWDELGQGYNAYSFNTKGRLGVRAQDTEDGKGVKVIKIEDESAAEKAGLKEDDIITEFDGKTINSTDELASAARGAREKNSVPVKILRGGKAQTIEIKTPKKLKTTNL